MHIQIVFLFDAVMENQRENEVDDETDRGNAEHESKLDRLRMNDTLNAFNENSQSDDTER